MSHSLNSAINNNNAYLEIRNNSFERTRDLVSATIIYITCLLTHKINRDFLLMCIY